MGDAERILHVAQRLIETQRQNCRVVGVISAMAGVTDNLIKLAHSISPQPTPRELDLLLATGETADGVTHLVDRQHPHDLFMELSASYSFAHGEDETFFLYGGLPGEPALGPPAFLHRFSGMDNPEAPISHHWLDSTHITYGVVTAGFVYRGWKLEGSIFGYFVEGELRGAGELRMIGDDHRVAEAAFSVEHDWRRQGVGEELMTRIVRAARNARVETLYMSCLATNRAMQNLAKHFEAELHFETDEVTGKLVARPAPTPVTQWKEIVDDATSFATAMVDLQRRTWRPRLGR